MNYLEGDILLLSTENGGDLSFFDGLIEMTGGFETATYLSLFGGNIDDNGTELTKSKEWWGNKLETNNEDRKLVSRTQNALRGLPATPANLNIIQQLILLDLNWFIESNIVEIIQIDLSIPAKNRIKIEINMLKDEKLLFNTVYEKNWLAQSQK